MGGIAVELVLRTALRARGAWRDTLGRRIVRGVGAALVLHASWYLATGAFSGFGDGVLLYRELGAARVPVAIGAGLVTCAAAYSRRARGPRCARGDAAATSRRGHARRVRLAGGAPRRRSRSASCKCARDRTYTETMQPERERVIAQSWRWEAHPQASAPERGAEVEKIEAAHPRRSRSCGARARDRAGDARRRPSRASRCCGAIARRLLAAVGGRGGDRHRRRDRGIDSRVERSVKELLGGGLRPNDPRRFLIEAMVGAMNADGLVDPREHAR